MKKSVDFDLPMMDLPDFSLPSLPGMPDIPGLSGASNEDDGSDDADEPVERKVAVAQTEFMKRAQAEQKRTELVTDSEFWFCVCFETREQKDKFLKAAGLWDIGDKYLDGRQVSKALGVDPGAKINWPKTKGLSDRLKKHVE